ncbi:MAG: 23S rRNA (adenine(2503)-C(2))-methyltransferase RlmN [candidate division WOR-3 bacterium]|nr:MAG: 23S rRNA (adenine(2503)-C(2))-methyltransferase RlmN [candidate division WOR-3 bacterium]
MTRKPDIKSLTLSGLEELTREMNWESYRARQLFSWLWQKDATGFDAMTNLGKDRCRQLADRFRIGKLVQDSVLRDEDGTTKFSWRLDDGAVVESVYIPEPGRKTVCISTQVGCGLGCELCYTAKAGLERDLGWHEIAGQVQAVQQRVEDRVTNVVLMGMGEPFLNYEPVLEAVRAVNSDFGINIGARRITVSTAGIPDRIRDYARFPLQSKLAVSLNASDDETRNRLMPINRTHQLEELMSAVREFTRVKGKRVTFEYVLLDGINNRRKDIHQLAKLLRDVPCKVNLIPFNRFPDTSLRPPPPADVERFAKSLYPLLPAVTVRRSRGSAILAGCGQLAGRINR